jgi:2-phospho-L-lactate guanylyltransferase
MSALRFCVLVPVKPTAVAKSRLSSLGDPVRRALVAAFAADTVTAALDCAEVAAVLAVTDDAFLARALADLGAHVLPDGTTDDLNASLVQAAAEGTRRWPDVGVAALCADLPSLRPSDLSRALVATAEVGRAFVTDAEGTGTTLVASVDAVGFTPCFGTGSRAAHLAAGLNELVALEVASLRRDVDTPADLDAARALGLGPRTTLAAAGHRL